MSAHTRINKNNFIRLESNIIIDNTLKKLRKSILHLLHAQK